jgi:SAM-dependent methyltransferase
MIVSVSATVSDAQQKEEENYDLLYVPTPQALVNRMLQLAKIDKGDVVYDLGCGDGRVVITAAKRYGVEGVGVDLNPKRIKESRANAKLVGVEKQVTFHKQDLFDTNVRDASVVALYLLPEVMEDLRSKLLNELKPGTVVVSHDFAFGQWKPDRHLTYGGAGASQEKVTDKTFDVSKIKISGANLESALANMPRRRDIYYWIVPVRAEGAWQWQFTLNRQRQPVELNLKQQYQQLDGTLQIGDGPELAIQNARISGRQVQFQVELKSNAEYDRLRFTGVLRNGEIDGAVLLMNGDQIDQQEWIADRVSGGADEWGS